MNRIDVSNVIIADNDIPIPQRLYASGVKDTETIEKVLVIVYFDPLTHVYNRLYFNDIINRQNVVEQNKSVFAMIDIDHFKKVNDTYGHDVGDVVLRIFAQKLKEKTERAVIRYGGEEFMLIDNVENVQELLDKIEQAREEISQIDFVTEKGSFNINFSCGIATSPKQADDLLYKSKENGRGKTTIDETLNILPDKENEILPVNDYFSDYEQDISNENILKHRLPQKSMSISR